MLATGSIAMRPLDDLWVSPDNPRTISQADLERLKQDLTHDPGMLWARPVIATPEGEVVAGNMRRIAAGELGWSEVPTYTEDLDPVRKREWMLRDNAQYGDWIPGRLADTIAQAADEGASTAHFGFAESQIVSFLAKAGRQAEAAQEQLPMVWGVVVECDSADQQAGLLERLSDEGLRVRALTA